MSGSRFTFTLFILAAITANPAFAAELQSLPSAPHSALAQLMLGTLQAAEACVSDDQQQLQQLVFTPQSFDCPPAEGSFARQPAPEDERLRQSDLASAAAARAP